MRIDATTIETFKTMADDRLKECLVDRSGILQGPDAWTVAHQAGIVRHAYDIGADVTDGHIQTALERVFPNAVFKDKKVY